MTLNFDNFNSKFKVDELILKEFKYWRWSIRPAQLAVPSTILSLRRPVENLADMSEEETAELSSVFSFIENKIGTKFDYSKINYLALMMLDFQVHFHVLARYDEDKVVNDIEIQDNHWPGPPNVLDGTPLSDELKEKIRTVLT